MALRRPKTGGEDVVAAQVQALQAQLTELGRRLDDGLADSRRAVVEANSSVTSRMQSMAEESRKVQGALGTLTEQTRHIQELGKSMAGLEQVLKPPKARGGLGELLLESLLSQILPREHFEAQYKFKDGTVVDAVIRFKDWLLPIDSKFPLENFRRHLDAANDADRLRTYKEFTADCIKHVDKIGKTYIRPDEKTLDIAFMYIPAENVYYHILLPPEGFEGKSVMEAAWEKKVIPVSPGTLFAYLQVILVGLRGMRVEEQARSIFEGLAKLRRHLEAFNEEYRKVGSHLSDASKSFEKSSGRLEKLGQQIPGEGVDGPLLPPPA